ncbi:MAG: hypothetical protein LBJ46_03325 [Planctomycetota bacterium]|jgi:hypothetical protein|nr:hypothetical protein [Planctomycetota bacterium]
MSLDDLGAPAEGMDLANLYKQENFTDLGLGTIQVLSPVTPDGLPDGTRQKLFMGTAQIMTAHGPLPVQCDIPADNFRAACEAFPDAIKAAVNNLVEQAKQIERERQGGIVIPRGGKLELP